ASIAQAPSLSLESADGGLAAGDVAAATMAGWSRLAASASGTVAVSGVPTPHPAKDRHSAASMLGMVRVTAVSWRGVVDASAMRGHGLPDAERAVVECSGAPSSVATGVWIVRDDAAPSRDVADIAVSRP